MVTDLVDDLVNTNGIWLSAWGSFKFMWVMPYIVEFGNIEFNSCEVDPLGLLNMFTSLSKQLEIEIGFMEWLMFLANHSWMLLLLKWLLSF